jgi:hypothetical protein
MKEVKEKLKRINLKDKHYLYVNEDYSDEDRFGNKTNKIFIKCKIESIGFDIDYADNKLCIYRTLKQLEFPNGVVIPPEDLDNFFQIDADVYIDHNKENEGIDIELPFYLKPLP